MPSAFLSHCVPTVLQMVLAAAENTDLSRWKVVIGGSAFPRVLAAAGLARGIDVFAGYGMSETGPLLTLTRAVADPDLEAQTAARTRTGFPIPLVDLRTVDADGMPTPRDGQTSGEVVVRAPCDPGLHAKSCCFRNPLVRRLPAHRRIGTLNDAGCLRITDRLRDVIKTGGEWISSLDLQRLFSPTDIGDDYAIDNTAVTGTRATFSGTEHVDSYVDPTDDRQFILESPVEFRSSKVKDAAAMREQDIERMVRLEEEIDSLDNVLGTMQQGKDFDKLRKKTDKLIDDHMIERTEMGERSGFLSDEEYKHASDSLKGVRADVAKLGLAPEEPLVQLAKQFEEDAHTNFTQAQLLYHQPIRVT